MTTQNIAERKANPTQFYESPSELEKAPLSVHAKLEILESWEQEAVQLQHATEENMTGGEASRLDEVRKAIDRIKAKSGD